MALKMVITDNRIRNMTSNMGRLFRPWAAGKLSTEEVFPGEDVKRHEICKQKSISYQDSTVSTTSNNEMVSLQDAQNRGTELTSLRTLEHKLLASNNGEEKRHSLDSIKNASRERHRTEHKLLRRTRVEHCKGNPSTLEPLSQQVYHQNNHQSSLSSNRLCSPPQTDVTHLNFPGFGSSTSAFTSPDAKGGCQDTRLGPGVACGTSAPQAAFESRGAADVDAVWMDLSGALVPWAAPCCVAAPELLLEGALAQGLLVTPAAVEEYARLLQQQHHRASAQAGRKQRPKKHRCPHCQVAFSNNGQLKGHIRIHTGERPYKCDAATCGKTFTRNEELTRHKRIHSGQRPYACGTCGKRFGRKDHLKKHSRTHAAPPRAALLPLHVPLVQQHFPYLYGF